MFDPFGFRLRIAYSTDSAPDQLDSRLENLVPNSIAPDPLVPVVSVN